MDTQRVMCVYVIGQVDSVRKKEKKKRTLQWPVGIYGARRGKPAYGRDCGLESYKNETARKIRYEEVCTYPTINSPYTSPLTVVVNALCTLQSTRRPFRRHPRVHRGRRIAYLLLVFFSPRTLLPHSRVISITQRLCFNVGRRGVSRQILLQRHL